MSNIIDISLEIEPEMIIWPGGAPVKISQYCSIDDGKGVNCSKIEMDMHAGTHIDVPLHFISNGKSTSNADLERFIGEAKVFCIDTEQHIGSSQLESLGICEGDIVLLNVARNNKLLADKRFHEDFLALNKEGAKYLVDKKIKAIGINYYSIEGYNSNGFPVHKTLLQNDIAIIEGLKLDGVKEGKYSFISLPLKFRNGNGSPVRAILIEEE